MVQWFHRQMPDLLLLTPLSVSLMMRVSWTRVAVAWSLALLMVPVAPAQIDELQELPDESWFRHMLSTQGWAQVGAAPTDLPGYLTTLLGAPTSGVPHEDLVAWTFPVDGHAYPEATGAGLVDDASAKHRVYQVTEDLQVHFLAMGAQRAQGSPADASTAAARFHTTTSDAAAAFGDMGVDGDEADVLMVCRILYGNEWYPCLGVGVRTRLGYAGLVGTGRVDLLHTSAPNLPWFDPAAQIDSLYEHEPSWSTRGPGWSSWATSERLDADGFSLLRTHFSENELSPPVWVYPEPGTQFRNLEDDWQRRPTHADLSAFADMVAATAGQVIGQVDALHGAADALAEGALEPLDLRIWDAAFATATDGTDDVYDALRAQDNPSDDVDAAWAAVQRAIDQAVDEDALKQAIADLLAKDVNGDVLTALIQALMAYLPDVAAFSLSTVPPPEDLIPAVDGDMVDVAPGDIVDYIWALAALHQRADQLQASSDDLLRAAQDAPEPASQLAFQQAAAAYAEASTAVSAVTAAAAAAVSSAGDAASTLIALTAPLYAEVDGLANQAYGFHAGPEAAALDLWARFAEDTFGFYMPRSVYDADVPAITMAQCEITFLDAVVGACREPLWRTGSDLGDFRDEASVAGLETCGWQLSPSAYNNYRSRLYGLFTTTADLAWTGVPAWLDTCQAFNGTVHVPWVDLPRNAATNLEGALQQTLQGRLVARYAGIVYGSNDPWYPDPLHHLMPAIDISVASIEVENNGTWHTPDDLSAVYGGRTRVQVDLDAVWSTAATELPGLGAATIIIEPENAVITADEALSIRQRAGPSPFAASTVFDLPPENLQAPGGVASNIPIVDLGDHTSAFIGHGIGQALTACVREAWSHDAAGPISNLGGAFAFEAAPGTACTNLDAYLDIPWPTLPGPVTVEVRAGTPGVDLILPAASSVDAGIVAIDLDGVGATLPWDPADPRHDDVLDALSHSHAARVVVVLPDTWSPEELSLASVLLAEAWHDDVSTVAIEIEDLPLPVEATEVLGRLQRMALDGLPVPAILAPAGSTAAGLALEDRLMGIWGLAAHPDIITIGSGTVLGGVAPYSRLGPGPDLAPKPDFIAPGLGDTASAVANALPVVEAMHLAGFHGPAVRVALAAVAVPHIGNAPVHTPLMQGHGVLDAGLIASDAGWMLPADLAPRALTMLGDRSVWEAAVATADDEALAGIAMAPGRLDALLNGNWPAITLDTPVLPLTTTLDHGTVSGAERHARLKLLDMDTATYAALQAHRDRLDAWEIGGLINSPWDEAIDITPPLPDTVVIETTHHSVFELLEADMVAGLQRRLIETTDLDTTADLAAWDLATDQPVPYTLVAAYQGTVQANASAQPWSCDGPLDPGALVRYTDAVGGYLDAHRTHMGRLAAHGVVGGLDATWFAERVTGHATAQALQAGACQGAIGDVLAHLDTLEAATYAVQDGYATLDFAWETSQGALTDAAVRQQLDAATTALGLPAIDAPTDLPINDTLAALRQSIADARAVIDEWLARLAPSQAVAVQQPRLLIPTLPAALTDAATPLGPYIGLTTITTKDQTVVNPLTGQPLTHPATGQAITRDVTTYVPALLWNSPDIDVSLRHRDGSAIADQGLSITQFRDEVFSELAVSIDATSQGLAIPIEDALWSLLPAESNATQALLAARDEYLAMAGSDPFVPTRVAAGLEALAQDGTIGLDEALARLYSHLDGVGTRTDATGAGTWNDVFPTARAVRLLPMDASTEHALSIDLDASTDAEPLQDLDRQIHRDIRDHFVGPATAPSNEDDAPWTHTGLPSFEGTSQMHHRIVEMHADNLGGLNQFALSAQTQVSDPERLTCFLVAGHNERLGTDFRAPFGCPDRVALQWPDDAARLVCPETGCAEALVAALQGDAAACDARYGPRCGDLMEAARALHEEVRAMLSPQRVLPAPWLRGLDDTFVSNPMLDRIDRPALVQATMQSNGVGQATATSAVDQLLADMADGINVQFTITPPARDQQLDLKPITMAKTISTDIIPGTDWCTSSHDAVPSAAGVDIIAAATGARAHLDNATRAWYDAAATSIEAMGSVTLPVQAGAWTDCGPDHGLLPWSTQSTQEGVSYARGDAPHLLVATEDAGFDWTPEGLSPEEIATQALHDVGRPADGADEASRDRLMARIIAHADGDALALAQNLLLAQGTGWQIDHHADAVRAKNGAGVAMMQYEVPLAQQNHLTATFAGEAYFENADAFLIMTPDATLVDVLVAAQANVSASIQGELPLMRPEAVSAALQAEAHAAGIPGDGLRIRHLNPAVRVGHESMLTHGDTLRQDELVVRFGGLRVKDATTTFSWTTPGAETSPEALHALVVAFPLVDNTNAAQVKSLATSMGMSSTDVDALQSRGATFILSDTAIQTTTYQGVANADASWHLQNPARPWIEQTDILWSQPAAKTPMATTLQGAATISGDAWPTIAPADVDIFDMDCADSHGMGRWYTPHTFGVDGIGSLDDEPRTWSADGRCVHTDTILLEPGTRRDLDARHATYSVPNGAWMAWKDADVGFAGAASYDTQTTRGGGWGGVDHPGIWYDLSTGPLMDAGPDMGETYALWNGAIDAGLMGLAGWTGAGAFADIGAEPSRVPVWTLDGLRASPSHVWRLVDRDDLLAAGQGSIWINDTFDSVPVAAGSPSGTMHDSGRIELSQDFDPARMVYAARLTTDVADQSDWTLEAQWGQGISGRMHAMYARGAATTYAPYDGIGTTVHEVRWYTSQGGNVSSPLRECVGFPAQDLASRHGQCFEGRSIGKLSAGHSCMSYVDNVARVLRGGVIDDIFGDGQDQMYGLDPQASAPAAASTLTQVFETVSPLVPLECHALDVSNDLCLYYGCGRAEASLGHMQAAFPGIGIVDVRTAIGSRVTALAAQVVPNTGTATTDFTVEYGLQLLDGATATLTQEQRDGTLESRGLVQPTGVETFTAPTGVEVRYVLEIDDGAATITRPTPWYLADGRLPELVLDGHDITLLRGIVVGPGAGGLTIGAGDVATHEITVQAGHPGFPGQVTVRQGGTSLDTTRIDNLATFKLRPSDGRTAETVEITVHGANNRVASTSFLALVPEATTQGGENKDATDLTGYKRLEWEGSRPSGGVVTIAPGDTATWNHATPSHMLIAEATIGTQSNGDVLVVQDLGGEALRLTKFGNLLEATTRDGSTAVNDPLTPYGRSPRHLQAVFTGDDVDLYMDGRYLTSVKAPRSGHVTGLHFAAGAQDMTIDNVRIRTLMPEANAVQAAQILPSWTGLAWTAPYASYDGSPGQVSRHSIDVGAFTTAVARVELTDAGDGVLLGLSAAGATIGALEVRGSELWLVGDDEAHLGGLHDLHRVMLEIRGNAVLGRLDDGAWAAVTGGGARPDEVFVAGDIDVLFRGLRFETNHLGTDTIVDDAAAGWDWTAARTTYDGFDTVGRSVLSASTKSGSSSIATPLPGVEYGLDVRFQTPGSTSAVRLVSGTADDVETWSIRLQKTAGGNMELLLVSSFSTKKSDPFPAVNGWQHLQVDVDEEAGLMSATLDGRELLTDRSIPGGTRTIVVGATSAAPATSLDIDDVSIRHMGWYAEDPAGLDFSMHMAPPAAA